MNLKTAKTHYQTLLKEWQELVKNKGIDFSDIETKNLNIRLSSAKKNLDYLTKMK